MNCKLPIGVLDSGIGGFTVLQKLLKTLPEESFLYLADSAHMPYGEKSLEELSELLQSSLSFFEGKVKFLILACHTLSSLPHMPKDILTMRGATQRMLQNIPPPAKITVIATRRTIASGLYQTPHTTSLSCPHLAEQIERGLTLFDLPSIVQLLLPACDSTQALLLACTHYPWITPLLQKIVGPNVLLLDPAHVVAEEAKEFVQKHSLQNPLPLPTYTLYTTGPLAPFVAHARVFFGEKRNFDCEKIDILKV